MLQCQKKKQIKKKPKDTKGCRKEVQLFHILINKLLPQPNWKAGHYFATRPTAATHKRSNTGSSEKFLGYPNQWRLPWYRGKTDWKGRGEKRWLCKRDAKKLLKKDFSAQRLSFCGVQLAFPLRARAFRRLKDLGKYWQCVREVMRVQYEIRARSSRLMLSVRECPEGSPLGSPLGSLPDSELCTACSELHSCSCLNWTEGIHENQWGSSVWVLVSVVAPSQQLCRPLRIWPLLRLAAIDSETGTTEDVIVSIILPVVGCCGQTIHRVSRGE